MLPVMSYWKHLNNRLDIDTGLIHPQLHFKLVLNGSANVCANVSVLLLGACAPMGPTSSVALCAVINLQCS